MNTFSQIAAFIGVAQMLAIPGSAEGLEAGSPLPLAERWRTETTIRLAVLQPQGEDFDDYNAFGISKSFKKGAWGWGIGFQDAEWNASVPLPTDLPESAGTEREAFVEARVYELFLEWEPPEPGVQPFAVTSLGYSDVSVESHPVDGVRPFKETHGHEWVVGAGAGLRWHTGKKAILEMALRAEYHQPDWRIVPESVGEPDSVDDYWLAGITLGLGLPY